MAKYEFKLKDGDGKWVGGSVASALAAMAAKAEADKQTQYAQVGHPVDNLEFKPGDSYEQLEARAAELIPEFKPGTKAQSADRGPPSGITVQTTTRKPQGQRPLHAADADDTDSI